MSSDKSHHRPGGGFRNPWPTALGDFKRPRDLLRWQWQRMTNPRASRPRPEEFPRAIPDIARPRVTNGELRITWVGHATFLIQLDGLNVLTDPVWSLRASPVQWIGPTRLTLPGLPFKALPPIDVVLVSHDHYDHLDAPTIRRLARAFPQARWIAPLGHQGFLRNHGAQTIDELDWWQEVRHNGVTITATPAQHWTRRIGSPPFARLWSSFALRSARHNVYFGGDSGYCPGFSEIGERAGPFDVAILPIGAYEPRWFMKQAHMNPEEAIQAHADVKARYFIGMHWGTFVLTDEHALEPPRRTRERWSALALPPDELRLLAFGETFTLESA